MACNNSCNQPCNCSQTASTPLPQCSSACSNSEKCEEMVLAHCVKYVGPNLPNLCVENGDRLIDILVSLNAQLGAITTYEADLIVTANQETTLYKYIDEDGKMVCISVSFSQSPVCITAQQGSVVKISGGGTFTLPSGY
jgi:hypothetical protein